MQIGSLLTNLAYNQHMSGCKPILSGHDEQSIIVYTQNHLILNNKMKLLLNRNLCKKFWKSNIETVKEPTRTKKLRDYCTREILNRKPGPLSSVDKLSIFNGIRRFLRKYEETEIEIPTEDEIGRAHV